MKQKFFLSFMAIAFSVLSVSAQNGEKLVVNAGNVEHITVGSDMNIILMPATESDNSISLDANASEKLGLRVSGSSMTVSLLKQPLKKEAVTVYLNVNKLKTLTVESNSTVKTVGVLNTPMLETFIDTNSKVHLKSTGEIKAYSLNDGEIKVKYLSENLLAKNKR